MTYIDYMNQLWRSAMAEPIPSSGIALYAFLVNECNARFWKMPVQCSTVRICDSLRISRQTLTEARELLHRRGLISFSLGRSRFIPPDYLLLELTDSLTQRQTLHETDGVTHIIKDKDKNNFNNGKSSCSRNEGNENRVESHRGAEAKTAGPSDYEGAF